MTEVKSVSGRRLLVCSFNSPPFAVRPNQRRERQEVSHVDVMGHKLEHPITPTWPISPRCHLRLDSVWLGETGEWNQLPDKRHLLSSSHFTASFWDYFITRHDPWPKLILALCALSKSVTSNEEEEVREDSKACSIWPFELFRPCSFWCVYRFSVLYLETRIHIQLISTAAAASCWWQTVCVYASSAV